MDALLTAMVSVFMPEHLLYLGIGVVFGLALGILPGLGGVAGLSILLPFVFNLDPGLALAMMIGLTAVGATSDIFPAVLLGIPGTAGGAASIVDGYQMAKRGLAARALSAAFIASMVGGLIGAVMLTGAAFAARPIILAVGLGEQMMLIILALTMVGVLTGGSVIKGLASCSIGLLLGAVGTAPATGAARLDFGITYLTDGIPLTVLALGLFAIPEIVDLVRVRTISQSANIESGWLDGLKDTWTYRWLVARCSILGGLLAALPGLGGAVIDWLAYAHVVQTTRKRDNPHFGEGDVRGVIAPESANNAKEGGALIPTLLFGIPGSGTMAVFLGGLAMLGIAPGIEMVTRHIDLTYQIIWSIALANVLGTAICFILSRPIAKLTMVNTLWLMPFLLGITFFAAFQATRNWGDILTLTVLGVIGLGVKRFGWSRPALLIGFVLSRGLEASIYQSMQVYGMSFLQRPVVIGLLVVIAIVLATTFMSRATVSESSGMEDDHKPLAGSEMLFCLTLLAFGGYALFDSTGHRFLGGIYPLIIGSVTILLLLLAAFGIVRARGRELAEGGGGDIRREGRDWAVVLQPLFVLLIAVALFGFLIGIALFSASFLILKARTRVWSGLVAAAIFVACLVVLADIVVIRYPVGLLQWLVPMPWPFK
jgi:TctA family transporter